ncbi:MAG: hypothetical protein M3P24_09435 [Gemmatimonadota bacterium]|nr:hypothetical protein [Gemmatimonadota bacterium]
MPESLLSLLAALGFLALLARIFRSVVRFGLATAEATAIAGLIEVSARRGDLTGLSERRAQEREARRGRRLAGALLVLWVVLLAVPPFTGWAREVYAACALLWVLPKQKILKRVEVGEVEAGGGGE